MVSHPGSTRQGQMAGLPGPLQNGSVMVICVLCVLISIDHFVSTHRRGDQTWLGKHLWLQWHRHETIISPAPISYCSRHDTMHISTAHAKQCKTSFSACIHQNSLVQLFGWAAVPVYREKSIKHPGLQGGNLLVQQVKENILETV